MNKRTITTLGLGLWLIAAPAFAELTELENELLYRTAHGSAADVGLLAKRTKKPNLNNELGQPLLSIAASRTDDAALDVVKALVKQGADVNDGGEAKLYPLIAAIQAARPDIVGYFIEKGADYRVKDASGTSAADYATQSRDPEVIRIVQDKVKYDTDELMSLYSAEGHQKLRRTVIYHSCALQYYAYYYATKQDPIAESVQKSTLDTHQKAIAKAMSLLGYHFKYGNTRLTLLYDAGKESMFAEMESLVSNRWRREKGVGQEGDMEKRCEPIATKLVNLSEDDLARLMHKNKHYQKHKKDD